MSLTLFEKNEIYTAKELLVSTREILPARIKLKGTLEKSLNLGVDMGWAALSSEQLVELARLVALPSSSTKLKLTTRLELIETDISTSSTTGIKPEGS